jgi:lipoprotein-anchoring transpeptidase ErfK/SrfK
MGALLAEARNLEASGELVRARSKYLAVLEQADKAETLGEVERRLGSVNVKLVTTPMRMPEKEDVVVKRLDTLGKLAQRFGTTVDLIQTSNNIKNPDLIKAGDKLRVLKAAFDIQVSLKKNELCLYMGGDFFKKYLVGTGKFDKTPLGTFAIIEKIKEPVWWHRNGKGIPYGHPDNILGTRWMSLRATGETPDVRGYGIHGTWDESTIGRSESAGCVRMRNKDVEELFMLVPVGTPVTISNL